MHTGSTSVLEFTTPRRSHRWTAFVRVGLAAAMAGAPVTAALAQSQQGAANNPQSEQAAKNRQGQTEGQRRPTPGRLVVPVTGTLETSATPATPTTPAGDATAAPTVAGTFAIQRFARTTEDAVAAVGTLTLTFTDPTTAAARTIITQVAMPLARSGETTPPTEPSPAGANRQAAATQPCETLSLVLGPIALNPLGVGVQLDETNVDLTVVQGAGQRLSGLLCHVTGLIGGTAAPAELVNTLNSLLDMLG